MKKLIPTIILVMILAGIYWYVQSQDFFRSPPVVDIPMTNIEVEQVSSFHLVYDDVDIRITRDDKKWILEEQSMYPLDPSRMDSWLQEFSRLVHQGTVEENPSDYSQFGLNPAKYEYSVTLVDGSTQTVYVGQQLPVGGSHYAKIADASAVHKLDNELLKSLKKDLLYFTDKKVLDLDLLKIHSIEMTAGDTHWLLERQGDANDDHNAPWKLNDKDDLGYFDISGILGQTINIKTTKIPIYLSDLEMEGSHLVLKVNQYEGDELVEHVIYGEVKDQENMLLWESGAPWGYIVDIERMEKLVLEGKR